ncbi:MAG: M13 family metallopeptidase [Calditrichia bacterium]
MKMILGLVVLVILGMGCSSKKGTQEKPIDPSNMDLTVRPGEDFYRFANGNWLKNNPIPAEYSRWGSFEILLEKNLKDLRTIFEEAAAQNDAPRGSNIQKIGDFYITGMDSEKIEEQGIQPLQEQFEKIAALKSKPDLQGLIAYFHTIGVNPGFHLFSAQDKKNSEMVIAWLYQGGLGLPDRDYYVKDDDRSREIRREYRKHVARMFMLMGDTTENADRLAETVMQMETRLAKASMTRLELRDPQKTYHPMSLRELDRLTPAFNWASYFREVGVQATEKINVAQPEFFKEAAKMIRDISLDDWKTYLRWHLIHNAAPYLNSEFVNENFRFYGTFLSGTEKLQPRWKRVLRETSSSLGEIVGQMYVERYFPPRAKTRMVELVNNLKTAFANRIKNVEWMTEESKQRALEKLAAFGVKIGYPDEWIDYSTLEIQRDSYVMNVLRATRFEVRRDLNKIGKPVDRTEWGMTPQTVNAYYHPFLNEIVFPAAILQPPFFNFEADDAVNYGAIGVVIGHEMTHGFDDQGRQFDAQGNLNDWWNKEDEERFKTRAEILVRQYNEFVPVDTFHVNGKLTLGENIADLGGLNIAYDAFQMAKAKNPQTGKIDGFTPEQRFFLSYAQIWRNNIRPENLKLRLKTDVHSPGEFRANGPLMNMPAFYASFDIKEGDPMYRPESQRAQIW